jgi:hypothetical protein
VGHGVPAAMLSFTIHYSLKDIIEKNPERETGALLKILHNKILKKLMGDKERLDFLSGADISLVKIDKINRSIQFSGAKSPLITVNTNGLVNYKGELIGINFDRSFTATINDYAWNENYSRSIGCDIRYALFVMKYVSKADHILAEIGITEEMLQGK